VSTLVDAVQREVAWLNTSGDGLPDLLKDAGGPWDVIQAFGPRTPATRQCAVYALLPMMTEKRISNARKMQTFNFRHRLEWPIGGSTVDAGFWEAEQGNFAAAVDLLIARVRGTLGDHSHGGRFLSAAEDNTNGRITVQFEDPDTRNQGIALLRGHMMYSADGFDFTG
jgi:hypothetical protein